MFLRSSVMRAAILALCLAVLPALSSAETYRGYPEAPYRIEQSAGAIELRSYAPRLVAEVTVRASRDRAINRGFRELAGYIFGDNAAGQKIAMTVPVDQTETPYGWVTRFTLPEGAALADLPKPETEAIVFRRLPAERMLVGRFSGVATTDRLEEAAGNLRAWADVNGLKLSGAPVFMFYDGPFTLPWNRRNEVGFTLAE
jgi:hypothetical protein